MVLGFEPLCYQTGHGFGMQNKDMLLVTETGCELLSDYAEYRQAAGDPVIRRHAVRTLIENLEFALTVDRNDTVLHGASVVVNNDRIGDIGPAADVARRNPRESFDAIIDGSRYGMTPGFIDSHVHLSETLSRAVFPDTLATRAWVFHWAKPFYAAVDRRGRGLRRAHRHGGDAPLRHHLLPRHGRAERRARRGRGDRADGHARHHRPARRRRAPGPRSRPGWTEEMMASSFLSRRQGGAQGAGRDGQGLQRRGRRAHPRLVQHRGQGAVQPRAAHRLARARGEARRRHHLSSRHQHRGGEGLRAQARQVADHPHLRQRRAQLPTS